MKHIEKCKVVENRKIIDDVYEMTFYSKKIIKECKSGQFLQISVNNQDDPLLRRPISVNTINKAENTLTIYYKIVGKGTNILSRVKKGDIVSIIGPLGNGFKTNYNNLTIAIVGGGIGIAPLLQLIKDISNKNRVYTYLGFNNHTYLTKEFKSYSEKLVISTVTGNIGFKGYITDALKNDIKSLNFDIIYSCGPTGMLRQIVKLSNKYNIKNQMSLEERMACGFGACLGCSIETSNGSLKKVCTDGPVFWSNEVIINE